MMALGVLTPLGAVTPLGALPPPRSGIAALREHFPAPRSDQEGLPYSLQGQRPRPGTR